MDVRVPVKATLAQRGISYPAVTNLKDRAVAREVNRAIQEAAQRAIPAYDPGTSIAEATSGYETMLNANGILSLRFQDYIYPEMAAHGVTQVSSVTVDLGDGHVYRFDELFLPGSHYRAGLNRLIEAQIAARGIPILRPFQGVSPNQAYYLTQDSLVIYYQPYDYTPGAFGVLEFKIPYAEIANLINPRGPIGRLF